MVGTPAGATSPTCRTEPLWPDAGALVNCSAASTGVVRSVLEGTDAFKQGLISPQDRFLANTQWLVWIDSTRSPGTMHGLWALTPSGAFAGITDPTVAGGSFKSLIAIGAGFGSSGATPKRGYRGTHVEIWHSPGSWYYTYPNGPPLGSDLPPVQPDQSVSRYSSLLVDNRDGSPAVLGVNGVTANMGWTVSYTIEPDRFLVEAELVASADLEFTGDMGGLLLLTNPACTIPGNYGDCPDAAATLSTRSLHRVVSPISDDLLSNRQIAMDTDQFQIRHAPDTWELVADAAAHNLVMSPQWSVTDPLGQPFTPKAAYHYNSSAFDVGGLNGFGSLDVVIEPPPGGAIALGPTRGSLRFAQVLTHRTALTTGWAVAAANAEKAFRVWVTAGVGLLFWGFSATSLWVSVPLRNTRLAATPPVR